MPQVAINMNELVYYVQGRPWSNIANSISEFASRGALTYSTNADGYPIGITNPNDLYCRLDLGPGYPNGTYTVTWDGPNNAVTASGGTNGATSCTFTKSTSTLIQLFDIKADITDLRIVHSSENVNETFNPVYLEKMKDFAAVRLMNWSSPNHDWVPNWATRRKRTSWTQGRTGAGSEVAWEYQCDLANKIRKPLWICAHWKASFDYCRNLAQLIHATLDPDLPLYIEHANEVWNGAFPQNLYSRSPGVGNMTDTDQFRRGAVWHMKRTADIGDIFKAQCKGRKVIVTLGLQATSYADFDFQLATDPTPDSAAAIPRIDAYAIAPYFGNYCMSTDPLRDAVLAASGTAAQLDVIFAQLRTHFDMTSNSGPKTQMTQWKTRTDAAGKILVGYEGGQHISLSTANQSNSTLVNLVSLANRDARMYNLYLEYMDEWNTRTGGALMFLFNDVQDNGPHGAWGLEEYEGEAQFRTGGAVGTNHKYKAVWDWISGRTLAGPSTVPSMFRAVTALPVFPEPNMIYAIKEASDTDCQIVMTDRGGAPIPCNTGNVYVDVYETPGTATWTKRAGAVSVKAIAIGGGNGGGSGRRGAAGSERYGGGGGGGGGIAMAEFPASALGSTEFVWVGAGGAGGASQTTDSTNGNPGITGYPSAFGCADNTLSGSTATATKLKTSGATPAGGGTTSAGAAGTGGGGHATIYNTSPSGVSGGAGSNGAGTAAAASGISCAGGGGGGGVNASNVAAAGAAGGSTGLASGSGPLTFHVGGAGGAVGQPGESGSHAASIVPGSGGGGGGGAVGAVAGAGGNGGLYGAGGGGGGASENGFASGKGGDGANGVVVVISLIG